MLFNIIGILALTILGLFCLGIALFFIYIIVMMAEIMIKSLIEVWKKP
ncbi:hypothetical protein JC2156_05480 [Weissella koreensis KCTC 3621]|nr:hypothetical protein JC2156_05480 [Weissella koreensis KCTC 3621]